MTVRRVELERTVLARVQSVADPTEVEDPEYVVGLRSAVSAAVDCGIAALEGVDTVAVPPPLFSQARHAARIGVSLDTVVRRYVAGYALLGDFLLAENEGDRTAAELQSALRSLSAHFDRIVAAISQEYTRELRKRHEDVEGRRAERVRMLLTGQLLDAADLDYKLDTWHLGVVAEGPGVRAALRGIAAELGRRLLAVRAREGELWAWVGGPARLESGELLRAGRESWPAAASLAVGEPGRGIDGWRFSHRQAKVASAVARRGEPSLVSYAEVALVASAIGDDILARSLREIYLEPLRRERDSGAALLQALRAYFATGHNVSSAAALLGVNRKTVSLRLRTVERKIGRPLEACAAEMRTALTLGDLTGDERGVASPRG